MEMADARVQEEDMERLLIFDQVRRVAEANHAKNPYDPDNLTKWGAALLELSQVGDAHASKKMRRDAISKLEMALEMNPRKHEAMWCLANAHTSEAFLTRNSALADGCFEKASQYFQRAVEEAPENDLYQKGLEASYQAPLMYMELQKGLDKQTQLGGSSTPSNVKSSKKKTNNDLKYDIGGWIILAIGVMAWIGVAKSQAPPYAR